ncbi:5'-methylthioadenosine/S-adenosylhomocysteine nucleosidase [Aspergillus stella-maris]|uniref:5'-methylthioadenosine/S-adenosylhomocysteine nucleosidase n=1 Tax=Aspergillus stella-maris TaxID=1810926 RepID=UPI003CCD5982
MVPGLLQWSDLVSECFNLPSYHLLDIAETETIESTLLSAKERLTSTSRLLCPQKQLLVYLLTKVVVGTAHAPNDLVRTWVSFSPMGNDIPVSDFNIDIALTRAWYNGSLSAKGCQKHGPSQTTHEALSFKLLQDEFHHQTNASRLIIVVRIVPDWMIVTSILIWTLSFIAVMSLVKESAKRSMCFGAMVLLSFICLMPYISRKYREWPRDETKERETPEESPQEWEPRTPITTDDTPRCTAKHISRDRSERKNSDRSLRTLRRAEYTVGLICALPIELATLKAMLNETHADLPALKFDDNNYTLGRICSHNVVIACLPTGIYGPVSAATVAARLLSTFQSIRFGLMIGIGGGVPSLHHDIRLGDVVVGEQTKTSAGVFQCDVDFEHTSTLSRPPCVLLNAVSRLQANHIMSGSKTSEFLATMLDKYPMMRETITPKESDTLFISQYKHLGPKRICDQCDRRYTIARPQKQSSMDSPQIHYGPIASVTQVVRDGELRDRLASRFGNLCFEMEAAGMMDNFPCLVIRGISDYADSHKNDNWHGYAAATAAAYAKELLSVIPPEEIENVGKIPQLSRL